MTLLALIFFAMCAISLIAIISDTGRVYQFRFLMGATFAGFIAPQLFILTQHKSRIPSGSFEAVTLMAILCLACCWCGSLFSANSLIEKLCAVKLDEIRLYAGGILLLVVGTFFDTLKTSEAELGVRDEYGNWTGTVTIYAFFASLTQPALAIIFRYALLTRSLSSIILVIFSIQSPILLAIFAARREATVLTLMTIGITIYFEKGWKPPRVAVIILIVFAALFIPVTGQYRAVAKSGDVEAIQNFDIISAIYDAYTIGQAPELTFAANAIATTQTSEDYGFGRIYWNVMVFRFVPAQIIGMDWKRSLQFDDRLSEAVFVHTEYYTPGTTITGLADSFMQFGYFGSLFFLLMAYLFHTLWYLSTVQSSTIARLFYIQNIVSSMRALTHQTSDFCPALSYNIIFLGAVCWWASTPRRAK